MNNFRDTSFRNIETFNFMGPYTFLENFLKKLTVIVLEILVLQTFASREF